MSAIDPQTRTRTRHLRRRHARRGGRAAQRRADHPQRRRPGGARRRGRAVVLRGGGAPPPRVRRLEPRDRARRRGRAHRAASTSAPRSPCSPAMIRCASTSGSRRSTRSRSGRAEVILGRGSFIESFPLFGYDLRDYEVLFEEKLDLFSQLLDEKPVTWQGTTRAPLDDAERVPQDRERAHAPGSASAARPSPSCAPPATATASCSRSSAARPTASGRSSTSTTARSTRFEREPLPVGVHSPGHIAETDQQAWDEAYEGFESMNNTIGRERGWPPYSRMRFQHDVGPEGALYVGSPETVARKIADTVRTLGIHALRHEVLDRHALAREDDALDRAVRHAGAAARARHARRERPRRARHPYA